MRYLAVAVFALILLANVGYAALDEKPAVKIVALDSRGFVVKDVNTFVMLKIEAEDDGFDAGISSIELYDNGARIDRKECFFVLRCEWERTVSHNDEGTHVFRAVAIDASHRVSASATVKFRGIEQAPEIRFVEKPKVEEGRRLEVDVVVSDVNNDVVSVEAEKLPSDAQFIKDPKLLKNRLVWIPGFDQSGTHTIRFIAIDSKNHKTVKEMSISVVNVKREPTVLSQQPDSKVRLTETSSPVAFSLDIADPDKDSKLEWRLDGKLVSLSKLYRYTPGYSSAGMHTLDAIVLLDKRQVASRRWFINVENVNRKPEMRSIRDYEIREGETVSFSVRATDKDNDRVVYSVDNLPSAAAFDPASRTFRWKTREGDTGLYRLTFTASDQHESDGITVDIRVLRVHHSREEQFRAAQKRVREQEKPEKQKQPQEQSPLPRLITLQPVCAPGYLCYSISYLR